MASRPRRRLLSGRLQAYFVLAVSLALTGVGTALAMSYTREYNEARFDDEADQLEILLRERMRAYEEILLAGRGLFVASGLVTRDEFRMFADSLDLDEKYPGVQGIGYAVWLEPDEVAAHEAAVRAEGFENFSVTPEGERENYTSIVYLEPFAGRNLRAFGFDMYSDPVRREAMERARDTGEAQLSGHVTLVQEFATGVQPGFLMYVPLYEGHVTPPTVEARRELLLGWVYAPFRASDLMRGVLRAESPNIEFELFDGPVSRETLLFDSQPTTPIEAPLEPPGRTSELVVAGRVWNVRERPLDEPLVARALPFAVFAGGVVTSALLFAIAWSLATTQERAIRLAGEMTRELRAKRDELQVSNEALQAFTYVVSHDLKEPVRGVEAYLRILREDHEREMTPEAAALAAKAHESTQRMSALLNSLLQLSHVTRERLLMQPVSVADVLASDECRLAYERLQAEVDGALDVDAPTRALAAPSVLAQALGNLVANAYRHGARRVLVREIARRGGRIEVRVEDDGPGVPQDIVERFNAGGHEPAGGGFGLLIARRAVERLGGRVWLGRSDRLGGASVSFSLMAA